MFISIMCIVICIIYVHADVNVFAYEYVNEVQNKALNITIGNVLTNVIIATETAIIISCVADAESN